MAKIEPGVYEPRDDIRVFDGAEDDIDDEGSRLPLLIVIALLVLAAFTGVVYLAYTEGVQKGRTDAPRVITAQAGPAKVAPTDAGGTVTPYKGLKIYEQPAPSDDAADEDSAPTPPTALSNTQVTAAPATKTTTAPTTAPASTSVAPGSPVVKPATGLPAASLSKPASAPQPKPAETKVVATAPTKVPPAAATTAKPMTTVMAAARPPVATGAPTALQPAVTPVAKPVTVAATKPAPTTTAPVVPPAVASGGSFVAQIGSYKSAAEAAAAFDRLKARNPALVSGFSPNVRQVDLGAKGTWYRLRVGSFADKDSASALCSRLGGGCFPSKP